ncbi:Y-family DNA polymerase [Companilactobacillus sp.]|jgi:DNA polymerase V|uniref:Y-family DNA polymerase n=1 Tax=Companilactobacillus sp. TaxID=2767905 RepID=UPI0025C5A5C3|nr:Y-family DNA polymerase [Companilactobacillus sp.]MCH4007929.1 Y-family DNA polymerase [Companilactobacillus sp.]MCH4051892.1 Y-family DNA polymerase [Companilactobacillus sp.]MCH4075872.1 Y-family DNA polymerase [Companilactobacillus sp.]MCH4124447.1 Y-family DNA polymerase [Companilactobacillus sp.]MCH4132590.1 Y-family DNA polymerase [Companilactobacillus sp.]
MVNPLDDPERLPVRDIMCIDCKSFYASTEAIRRGEFPLAAKIAVLSRAESNGGLILAASPDTKKDYGVKLGTRKFEITPDMDIELAAPHMADYIKLNYRINKIFRQFTDDQHWYVYSVDESFIDCTHSHDLFGSNEEIADKIQKKVFKETGIVTTIGIGPNPLMAKLALDNAAKVKAPWRATWSYEDVPETIWKIGSLTDFWSIGAKTAAKLEHMGIHSIYDLAHSDRKKLNQKFGVLGDALYFHSWGIDYSDLARRYVPREDNKGYGNSQVLMRDYSTVEDIETVLFEIADQVATRLRKHKVQGEVIGISVGFSEPNEHNQRGWSAQTTVDPTNQTNDLIRAVKYLFEKKWQGESLRNLGVRVNRVSKPSSVQLSLFENAEKHEANLKLEHTIDQIRDRYGYKSIVRGYSKKDAGTAIERSKLVGGHQA